MALTSKVMEAPDPEFDTSTLFTLVVHEVWLAIKKAPVSRFIDAGRKEPATDTA